MPENAAADPAKDDSTPPTPSAQHNLPGPIPVLTRAGDVMDWASEHGWLFNSEEVETLLARVGRRDGPLVFDHLATAGLLAPDALRLVGIVWSMDEYPDTTLPHDTWLLLFQEAGYTVEGRPAARPEEPLRLFRGSVPERRAGWSWTDDLDVAHQYAAGGWAGREGGAVWTALVPPDHLLARNTGRDESEYVVNTQGLIIERLAE